MSSSSAVSNAFLVGDGQTTWVEVIDAATGDWLYWCEPGVETFTLGENSRSIDIGRRVRTP